MCSETILSHEAIARQGYAKEKSPPWALAEVEYSRSSRAHCSSVMIMVDHKSPFTFGICRVVFWSCNVIFGSIGRLFRFLLLGSVLGGLAVLQIWVVWAVGSRRVLPCVNACTSGNLDYPEVLLCVGDSLEMLILLLFIPALSCAWIVYEIARRTVGILQQSYGQSEISTRRATEMTGVVPWRTLFYTYITTNIAAWLLAFLPPILLYLRHGPSQVVTILVAILLYCAIMPRLAVTIPVAVIEGCGLLEGLNRAEQVVGEHRWRAVLLVIGYCAIVTVVGIFTLVTFLDQGKAIHMLSSVLGLGIVLCAGVLISSVTYYCLQREGNDRDVLRSLRG